MTTAKTAAGKMYQTDLLVLDIGLASRVALDDQDPHQIAQGLGSYGEFTIYHTPPIAEQVQDGTEQIAAAKRLTRNRMLRRLLRLGRLRMLLCT